MSHCCGGSHTTEKSTKLFQVTRITCNHCVMSIKKAVGKVPGVADIEVSLDSGTVAAPRVS